VLATTWVVAGLLLLSPADLSDDTAVDLVTRSCKDRPPLDHIGFSLWRVFAGFGAGAAMGTAPAC
jgi:ABC-type nitrate/sulfonate/bicarbonate transport system permease component